MIHYAILFIKNTGHLKWILGAKVNVELRSGPKQVSTADCELLSIATCVSLATGSQPKDFIQQFVCDHLLLCFEIFTFTTFLCEDLAV